MERSKIISIVLCLIFGQSILALVRYTVRDFEEHLFFASAETNEYHIFKKNKLTIDRAICQTATPDSVIQSLHCGVKHVSRTNLKIDFGGILTRPVNGLWVHIVVYYKFNGITFSKFPIELLEDLCGWMNGTAKSFVMDVVFSKLLKYTNMNHPCPYVGAIWVKVNSIPEDTFTFEKSLMPSGKFRVDFDYMESPESVTFMNVSLHLSVSDHRLEIV